MELFAPTALMIIHVHVPKDSLVNSVKSVLVLDLFILKRLRVLITNVCMVYAIRHNLILKDHQTTTYANALQDIQVSFLMLFLLSVIFL